LHVSCYGAQAHRYANYGTRRVKESGFALCGKDLTTVGEFAPPYAGARHGSMHHAEIGHLGDGGVRRCLPQRREHRHHGIIDTDIDAAAFARDRVGSVEYRIGIGDIGGNHERAAAKLFRLVLDVIERRGIARDQGGDWRF
jgi:hypothetical protein